MIRVQMLRGTYVELSECSESLLQPFPVVHSRKMFQAMALATRHDTAQISCTRESQGNCVGNHMVCPEFWLQFPGGSGNDFVILRNKKPNVGKGGPWSGPLRQDLFVC